MEHRADECPRSPRISLGVSGLRAKLFCSAQTFQVEIRNIKTSKSAMQAGLGLAKNGQGPQAGLLDLATVRTNFTEAPGPVQEEDLGARSTSHSRLQGPSPPLSNLHLRVQFHVFYCLDSPSSLFPSLCLLCPCSSCTGVSPKWIFRKLPRKSWHGQVFLPFVPRSEANSEDVWVSEKLPEPHFTHQTQLSTCNLTPA